MGFDFFISIALNLSRTTGRPFHYDGTGENPSIPSWEVPEAYRRFLYIRGHHMHAYLQEIPEWVTTTTVGEFLRNLPSTEQVFTYLKDHGLDDDPLWGKEEDRLFREALAWFNDQPYTILLEWSY